MTRKDITVLFRLASKLYNEERNGDIARKKKRIRAKSSNQYDPELRQLRWSTHPFFAGGLKRQPQDPFFKQGFSLNLQPNQTTGIRWSRVADTVATTCILIFAAAASALLMMGGIGTLIPSVALNEHAVAVKGVAMLTLAVSGIIFFWSTVAYVAIRVKEGKTK